LGPPLPHRLTPQKASKSTPQKKGAVKSYEDHGASLLVFFCFEYYYAFQDIIEMVEVDPAL